MEMVCQGDPAAPTSDGVWTGKPFFIVFLYPITNPHGQSGLVMYQPWIDASTYLVATKYVT
jgi:hypothetical protein